MKTRRTKLATTGAAKPSARQVHFEVKQPGASDVSVAGSFNEWHPQATPMIDAGDGRWIKDLMLVPGTYEYLFVVDGRWLPDPAALDGVPNPFGGWNSRLRVP